MKTSMAEILPRVPVVGFFEITEACTLRCVHCEASAGARDPDELTTDEALGVATQLAAAGCRQVNITGGEPLVRKDWPEICRRFADLGVQVTIVTNGTLVDRPMAARMVAAGVANVAVSLDGDKSAHDAIRVPASRSAGSSYDKAVAALEVCRTAGLRTAAITVLHRKNRDCLGFVHDLVARLGVALWQVQLAMPLGRLSAVRDDYMVGPEHILPLEEELAALVAKRAVPIAVADNIGYYGRLEPVLRGSLTGKPTFYTGCMAGCRVVGIRSNGDVKGCPSNPVELVVGNLRAETFAEIWGDTQRFSRNTAFREERLRGACRSCAFRRVCRGGCSSMAFALSGSVHENPLCLQRAVATPAGPP
ncbi:MAG: radical SAM protein [Deltaproteobacteria bacterium]|nr:radical SAM protein [Deltaproteobacteria bacterium]